MAILTIVLLVIILVTFLLSIKVVNTGYVSIVERFGKYHRTLEPGWHIIVPFADFVRKKGFYKTTNNRYRSTECNYTR